MRITGTADCSNFAKVSEFPGKHALGRPTTGPVRPAPASLPTGLVGRTRHRAASQVSVLADIHGGHVVAEE